ncbi:hypothetical protein AB0B45_07860 [Nonomuraea sp. NPDC049152]|uniref:hypothetical protein n=1 Tax=Nonomuraea sp. NPDC049152 TaxID=3154350 RepID=UPI0033F7CBEB
MPVLGAVARLFLTLPITGRSGDVYLRAAILVGIAVVLWFIDRIFVGPIEEVDITKINPPD